ncbi:MAG TPA: nitroreductase [Syntrophales bacterium]|nr:nitroreductase [Syntrophales bacterium]HPQ43311.1 nitroreductase [Syntrophales bacterium]
MDIIEAIYQRKSIRGFKPDPVPKDVLVKVLESACRAPSAMNTQPWEFTVMTGAALDRLRAAIVDKLHRAEPMEPELQVVSWSNDSIYRTRQIELAKGLFKLMDIPREDLQKRLEWLERGFRFFDAPVGILLLTDKSLSDSGPLLDLGAAMQNLCLAALNFGLGTCIEDQSVLYPEVLREFAEVPETKRIIMAIAIGYPDWDFPANDISTGREPLDINTRWLGF